jgi:hypothetical protein
LNSIWRSPVGFERFHIGLHEYAQRRVTSADGHRVDGVAPGVRRGLERIRRILQRRIRLLIRPDIGVSLPELKVLAFK